MSFIKELRRRNVIKVAIAYAIAAWLLIQIVATTFPVLQLPKWSVTFVTALILIGFPLALIFAWAFEVTPEGIKLDKDVERSESIRKFTGRRLDFAIIAILVLAVVYLGYDEIVIEPAREEAPASARPPPHEVSKIDTLGKSIAVLAFVNMSGDPGNEYFSDGLSEEILNLLAKIPDLKVIARTSSFAFKGKNEDVRAIGQALDVKTVLEGSVRKSGDRVRVTAQLIDVSDGSHIWSNSYDRTMTDIFAVQDDVAAAIIDALEIHVGANPSRGRPTENSEAYTLFLKARVAMNNSEWQNGKEFLLEAVALDPNFAEAYALLAYYYWSDGVQQFGGAEALKRTREAATKALATNPDLSFAQALLESTNIENYSRLRQIEAFERAAREERSNPEVLNTLIYHMLTAGYLGKAVSVAEQLVDLDPLSSSANVHLFAALYAIGRTSEAIAALDIAEQLEAAVATWWRIEVNLADKRDDIAIAQFEAALEEHGYSDTAWVRELVAGARDPLNGRAFLDRRVAEIMDSTPQEERHFTWTITTQWYQLFGHLDGLFEIILAIDTALGPWTNQGGLVWQSTVFRRLGFTAHPKYLEVAEMLGIVDVWEQRGPPDYCEKVGKGWVCE